MIFTRRRRPPPQLRPPLESDERVLAWARVTEHAAVVATNRGLFLPGRDARLGWHEIHKAEWTGRRLVVTPAALVEEREGYEVLADAPPLSLDLADPGQLPHVVRSRVTRSVSFSSHQPLPQGGVRATARRVPGRDGLRFTVRYDEGADLAAPGVREATDELVAALATAAEDPSI